MGVDDLVPEATALVDAVVARRNDGLEGGGLAEDLGGVEAGVEADAGELVEEGVVGEECPDAGVPGGGAGAWCSRRMWW